MKTHISSMRRYNIQLIIFVILFLSTSFCSIAQKLTDDEAELYRLIMQYRKHYGLPEIPVSKSLTFVAQTHSKDLEENYSPGSKCNLHSWSNRGKWKPVCYTSNHAKASLMWSKPRELTSYQGNGFEIAFAESKEYLADAETALESWKSSKAHNAVILNEGVWNKQWNAIGIGIYGGYAVVWFGNEIE